jgi:hypothetical protein
MEFSRHRQPEMEVIGTIAIAASCTENALSYRTDGQTVSVPPAWFPRLLAATPKQRAKWEFIGGGIGIHWPAIDEDISIESILQPHNFMPACELGRTAKQKGKAMR